MGIAYFLNSELIFVGFYPKGARANNTTLNVALRYGRRIITNCDNYSPKEVRGCDRVLNIDNANSTDLQQFIAKRIHITDEDMAFAFSWRKLVFLMRQEWSEASRRVG
jgi:hypothetical protein